MGVGGEKKPLPEIDSTRSSFQDDFVETLLEKIVSAGGEITSDESYPLMTESGQEDFEVGTERTIDFTLARNDFRLTRRVQSKTLGGVGVHKHTEDLATPMTKIILKKKSPSGEWQVVDLDALM